MKKLLALTVLFLSAVTLTSLETNVKKQLTLQVQIVYKMAWGGMGHHFKARVIKADDPEFLMTEWSFHTYSSLVFQELEALAGKETYMWEYGDPAMVSNNHTTLDIYRFEFQFEYSAELHGMPEEKRIYERAFIYEPARDIYWKIIAVKALP